MNRDLADIQLSFPLKQGIHFLNHGSYGATPTVVLDAKRRVELELEQQPLEFFFEKYEYQILEARDSICTFLHASSERTVFVHNATFAANAVFASLVRNGNISAGKGILLTNHVYPAVRNAAHYWAESCGSFVREVVLPLHADTIEEHIAPLLQEQLHDIGLACIDHITSQTAVILPVKELCEHFHDRGVPVFVDGAHAPGMLDVDVDNIGADFYTGNLHKWLFAPKSSAFLTVSEQWSKTIHPNIVSLYWGSGMHAEFHWMGTLNPSSWIASQAGLQFMRDLGVENVRTHYRQLTEYTHSRVEFQMGIQTPGPHDPRCAMAVFELPGEWEHEATVGWAIRKWLWHEHKVELHLTAWQETLLFRVSSQVYLDQTNIDAGLEALQCAIETPKDEVLKFRKPFFEG